MSNFFEKLYSTLHMWLDSNNELIYFSDIDEQFVFRGNIISSNKGGIIPKFSFSGCRSAIKQFFNLIDLDKGILEFQKDVRLNVGDDTYRYRIKKIPISEFYSE